MDCPDPVKETINDTGKGAAEVTRGLADEIMDLDNGQAVKCMETALQTRYNMTPVVNLVNEFFLSVEKEENYKENIKEFSNSIQTDREKSGRAMKHIIENKGYTHVLTLSYSSTVLEALKTTEEVTVLESSPLKEGRKTAEFLIEEDVTVNYWVDAAMGKALKGVNAVVMGADTVTHKGFLNKIGCVPLTLTARERDIPVYVVADGSKILPKDLPVPEGEKHPEEEVWLTDLDIKIHNDYFEFSRWKHASVVTEKGREKKSEIERRAEEKDIAERVEEIHPLV